METKETDFIFTERSSKNQKFDKRLIAHIVDLADQAVPRRDLIRQYAGMQLAIAQQQVQLTGLYHSTGSATFGVGMNYKRKYLISGLYTTQTSQLSSYTNGIFELNLRVFIAK